MIEPSIQLFWSASNCVDACVDIVNALQEFYLIKSGSNSEGSLAELGVRM